MSIYGRGDRKVDRKVGLSQKMAKPTGIDHVAIGEKMNMEIWEYKEF